MTKKNLLIVLGEWWEQHSSQTVQGDADGSPGNSHRPHSRRWLRWQLALNIGTVLIVGVLLLVVPSLAAPLRAPSTASTSTISYQGRLADSGGNPLTGKYNLEFRAYDVPSGGAPLWTEMWTGANAVDVSDGLFNVMLGSIDSALASSIEGYDELYLGITVGTDSEMVPRVQLGSVPFSMQAMSVPDGSVTGDKIASNAITTTHILDGVVTQAKLGSDVTLEPPNGSVTTEKLADGAVTTAKLDVDNGLGVNGNLTVAGNITLMPGWKQILFSDPGNCDFSIVHNGGSSLDFRSPQCNGITAMSVHNNGNVDVNGNFNASGTKSAIVQTATFGERTLYAVESPEVRFFDEDLAQLKNGVARVDLDPIFLETIEGEYLVHVTPYGDASLYVSEIGRDHFVVRVREGEPDVAFAWRLSAHRKGYVGVRLERVE